MSGTEPTRTPEEIIRDDATARAAWVTEKKADIEKYRQILCCSQKLRCLVRHTDVWPCRELVPRLCAVESHYHNVLNWTTSDLHPFETAHNRAVKLLITLEVTGLPAEVVLFSIAPYLSD